MNIKNAEIMVNGKMVKLKKSGKNFVGICPFHEEKTASFTVHIDRKKYYCFGCGASGEFDIEIANGIDIFILDENDIKEML
jgi:hypothetical protein